jgi:hypothetical protein
MVKQWKLGEVSGTRKDGTPLKGVAITALGPDDEETYGPAK